ncbi:hypothetical protein CEP54_007283 [Fusarium duplospermum]|uniref:Uncharacterized protein n=1 Tax=Fusarium duplospermum TaxID=1325734 RepID=A0A428Q256_9HYPO|nr:hypothetical protein CEP54_007283 [Fusarium duplospermum]
MSQASAIVNSLVSKAEAFIHDYNLEPWAIPGLAVSGLGVLYAVNKYLTQRALNHGTNATFDWKKEIILVTGGSGGIGGATVQQLARRGTHIVVVDVLPLTYKAPSNVHYYKCDLTNYEQLQVVAGKIRQEVGDPTVIVANAGVCRGKPIIAATKRDIELTFGVNTIGLIWTIKTFLPALLARNHGHLLIVASQTGHMATAGATDYSASKAAAITIYEGVHSEIKHVHKATAVRVSCISPSHVQTNMFTGIKSVPGMSSMTTSYLADRITGILYGGNARNILVPASASASPWIRVLPDWLRVYIQDLSSSAFTELKPHDPFKGQ